MAGRWWPEPAARPCLICQETQPKLNRLFSRWLFLSLNGKLLTGINGKWIKQDLPASNGWVASQGAGVDLGLLYEALADENGNLLQFGLTLSDPQTVLKNDQQGDTVLPTQTRMGGVWRLARKTLWALEFDTQSNAPAGFENFQVIRLGCEQALPINSGGEWRARVGYLRRLDQTGIYCAGFGWEFSDWRVDYALQLPAVFNNAFHALSVSWGWQRSTKAGQAPEAEAQEAPLAAKSAPAPNAPKAVDAGEARLLSILSNTVEQEEKHRLMSDEEEATPTPTPVPKRTVFNRPTPQASEEKPLPTIRACPKGPRIADRVRGSGIGNARIFFQLFIGNKTFRPKFENCESGPPAEYCGQSFFSGRQRPAE